MRCPWSEGVILVLRDDEEDDEATGTDQQHGHATTTTMFGTSLSSDGSFCLQSPTLVVTDENGDQDEIVHPAFWDEVMETFQSMLIVNAMNDIVQQQQQQQQHHQHISRSPTKLGAGDERPVEDESLLSLPAPPSYSSSTTSHRDNGTNPAFSSWDSTSYERRGTVRPRTRQVTRIPYDEMELVRNPAFDMDDTVEFSSESVLSFAQQQQQHTRHPQPLDSGDSSLVMLPGLTRTESVQRYLENVQLTAPTSLSTWPSSEDDDDDEEEEEEDQETDNGNSEEVADPENNSIVSVPSTDRPEPSGYLHPATSSLSPSPTPPSLWSGRLTTYNDSPPDAPQVQSCSSFSPHSTRYYPPTSTEHSGDDTASHHHSRYGDIRQTLSCPQ